MPTGARCGIKVGVGMEVMSVIGPPVATVTVKLRVSRPYPPPVTVKVVPEAMMTMIVGAKQEQLLPTIAARYGASYPHSQREMV